MESDNDAISEDSGITVGRHSFMNPSEVSLDLKIGFARVVELMETVLEPTEEDYEVTKSFATSIQNALYLRKDLLKAGCTSNSFPLQVVTQRKNFQSFTSRAVNDTLRSDQRILDRSTVTYPQVTHNSSFQLIPARNRIGVPTDTEVLKGKLQNANNHTIPESENEDEECDDNYCSLAESLGENTIYILKNWSIKKDDNNIYLTGIKLDRKGNLLVKDFTSKKVTARSNNQIVRTQCGDYKLDEPISDPKKSIPPEIKEAFLKEESHFPKQWRKLLLLWNEIEKKNKQKRKSDPKLKNQKRKSDPKPKPNASGSGNSQTSSEGDPNKSKMKKNISPEMKDTKKNTQGKKASPNDSKKEDTLQKKKKKDEQKTNKKTIENKATKQQDNKKKDPKKEKKADKPTSKKAENAKKKKLNEINEKGAVPIETELADLGGSVFEMPCTSLTPNGLMASIRGESINGRWTPPTNDFDNIYGRATPASSSSIFEDSFDIASKPTNVVKRMAKIKSAPKTDYKVSHKPALAKIDEKQNELVDHLIKSALTAKPSRTPELVKKVFRSQEKYDESDIDEDEM